MLIKLIICVILLVARYIGKLSGKSPDNRDMEKVNNPALTKGSWCPSVNLATEITWRESSGVHQENASDGRASTMCVPVRAAGAGLDGRPHHDGMLAGTETLS